jgi:hypothetical protein
MIGARLLLLLSVHLRVMERAHGFSLVEWACPLSSPCRHQQRHTRAELHETCGPQGASFWGEGSNRPGRTRIAVHFRCDVTRLCAASSPIPSSSPTNAATELPDSLEDAAIRAAQGKQRGKLPSSWHVALKFDFAQASTNHGLIATLSPPLIFPTSCCIFGSIGHCSCLMLLVT